MKPADTPARANCGVTQRWKWWLCGILLFATILNYLDRQTMGLCKSRIMEEFQINNEQFGNLLAAFRWTYALMHIPAGFIADHLPLRFIFAFAVGIWSLAGAAAFWVGSLGLFRWTRALLGLGEAVNWPFSTRIVANMLPREDRGLGMGIFNSGAALGALAAPVIITPVAHAYGWRWAFLVTGGAGFIWVFVWLWFTRGGRAEAFANPAGKADGSPAPTDLVEPFRTLLSHPGFWLLVLVSITINPCWYFCCDWIPGYLKEQSGFSFLRAGLLATFVFLGGDLGNYVGGGLVKYFTHRGWSVRKARGTAVGAGACLASCMALVPHFQNTYLIIALLALAGVGINIIVPNQTACFAEVSFRNTAQLAGLMGLFANVFAALVNPRIGQYVDATKHYDLVFYLVALFPWMAFGAIVAFDRLIERRRAEERKVP